MRFHARYLAYGFIALATITGFGLMIASAVGWREIVILSGSMRPEWARGTLLFLAPEPARSVRVGQAIAYHPPASVFNAVVVHQVIALHQSASGVIAQTKGLANKAVDPWKDYLSGMVYHVVFQLPYIGLLKMTWRIIAIAAAIGVAVAVFVSIIRGPKEIQKIPQNV